MYSKGFRPLSVATVVAAGGVRAGLLLRAQRRRPGLHPEDLLHPRADGDRVAVRVRGRRPDGHQAPAHRRPLLGHALLRGHPPVDHPGRRRAGHRLHLGQGLVGPLVGVGRARAGLVPGRLPPVLRLLPAALLHRGPRAPGALLLGLRHRRRRVRADQLRRRAHGPVLHPPARALGDRRQPARRHAADLPGLHPGHDPAVRDAVEAGAHRQARLHAAQAAATRLEAAS